VFQNKLRIVFGPKREQVLGVWRKLHNEELHHFYSSPDVIRIVTSKGMVVARMVRMRNAHRILDWIPKEKTTFKTQA